jgi:CDP-diacylglycerol--glycerol-3-phosphate 3-phosphatidyltransferase
MSPEPTPTPRESADASVEYERGPEAFWSDLKKLPNLLCVYRLVAILIAVGLFYAGYDATALILGITAGLTDYADGYIARKYNLSTELGALLDVTADLIFAFVSLLVAVDYDIWPIYLIFLWGLRDLSVLALRASAGQLGFTIPSMFLGKVASNFLFYSFVLFVLDYIKPFGPEHWLTSGIHYLGLFAIHAGIAMQWVSGFVYARAYIRQYRRPVSFAEGQE